MRVHIACPQGMTSDWLDGSDDIHVVGRSTGSQQTLRSCRQDPPDVLLVHAHLPGDPVALVETAASENLAVTVVLGESIGEQLFLEFASAGASGFANMRSVEEVAEAVRCVADGDLALSSDLTRTLLTALRRYKRLASLHESGPLSRLTPREWEVLDLLRQGLSTSQIAERLVLTPSTVRGYAAGILHALHAHSRGEAIGIADGLMNAHRADTSRSRVPRA